MTYKGACGGGEADNGVHSPHTAPREYFGMVDCFRRNGIRVAHPITGTPMRMGCKKIIAT
jgi:hypothetical protein